jgi:hypothetical protein
MLKKPTTRIHPKGKVFATVPRLCLTANFTHHKPPAIK